MWPHDPRSFFLSFMRVAGILGFCVIQYTAVLDGVYISWNSKTDRPSIPAV